MVAWITNTSRVHPLTVKPCGAGPKAREKGPERFPKAIKFRGLILLLRRPILGRFSGPFAPALGQTLQSCTVRRFVQ